MDSLLVQACTWQCNIKNIMKIQALEVLKSQEHGWHFWLFAQSLLLLFCALHYSCASESDLLHKWLPRQQKLGIIIWTLGSKKFGQKLSIKLIPSKAIGKIPSSLLFPAFLSVLFLIVFFWSGLVSASIQSSAVPVFTVHVGDGQPHSYTDANGDQQTVESGESCDIDEWNKQTHPLFAESGVTCQFDDLTADYPGVGDNLMLVQVIHLFGFYWCFNLVVAIGQFTLAGTFSQWYWTQRDDYKHLSKKPVRLALGNNKFKGTDLSI